MGRSLDIMKHNQPEIFRAEEPEGQTPEVLVEGPECGDDPVGS
jgi:hypothetical protein